MESIISALCTPNENLIRNTNFIFYAIEAFTSMLLFTTVLNVHASKKEKGIYIIVLTTLLSIINYFFPALKALITIITFLLIKKCFKLSLIKTFMACLIQFVITILLENLYSLFVNIFIGIPYAVILQRPIVLYLVRLLTFGIEYILYLVMKKTNFSIKILDDISPTSKKLILSNLFIGVLFMLLQTSMFNYYAISIPSYISLLNIAAMISYFIVSLYSLAKTSHLESANQRIENLELYNKTLNLLHDNIRAFKHDFNNIIQAIGRICCN